jgi:two-component system response regulator VanR
MCYNSLKFKIGIIWMAYNLRLFKKMTILFAEDEKIIREQTADMLKVFFADVLVASNGFEALEILADTPPDMILCDIKMPLMDGLVLTQKIRSLKNNLPIILLTSFSDQQTLLKAANAGIDGYILKPIELETLLETFDTVLKRKTPVVKFFTFDNGVVYNTLTNELYKHGILIDLGKKERNMLQLFIDNCDKTISKEELISSIWGLEEITESALKNLLSRLRNKIGFEIIVSVKGSGWRLNTSV